MDPKTKCRTQSVIRRGRSEPKSELSRLRENMVTSEEFKTGIDCAVALKDLVEMWWDASMDLYLVFIVARELLTAHEASLSTWTTS